MASKELYNFYKENKICVNCGQNNAVKNRVRCIECLAKNADRQAKRRKNMSAEEIKKSNEYHASYIKKMRALRKKDGLCADCGKPTCRASNTYCIDHYLKNKKRHASKLDFPRNERHYYGICYTCGKNPVIEGKKVCSKCYENNLNNLQKANSSEKKMQNRAHIRNMNRLIFNN